MFIVEKRLKNAFGIRLDCSCGFNIERLSYWISPFFLIEEKLSKTTVLLAQINIVNGGKNRYDYLNHQFYVDGSVPEKMIFYRVLSISRIIFKCIAESLGYHNLHAGCLAIGDKGILISAERNQGKTTVILRALQTTMFALVANDQIMYENVSKSVLGYPAVIGIRNGSCSDQQYEKIINQAFEMREDPFQNNRKPLIHINALKSILNFDVRDSTRLSLAVIYEKSNIDNELKVSIPFNGVQRIIDVGLPLTKTYSLEDYNACVDSISYYANGFDCIESSSDNLCVLPHVIHVKCGLSRINDMLSEIIKYI